MYQTHPLSLRETSEKILERKKKIDKIIANRMKYAGIREVQEEDADSNSSLNQQNTNDSK